MIRQFIKRLLRPLTVRVFARVDAHIENALRRIETRLDGAEHTLHQVGHDVDAFKGYVPTLLNALSSQNAAARQARRGEAGLEERVAAIAARVDEVGIALEQLQAAAAGRAAAAVAPPVREPDEVPS